MLWKSPLIMHQQCKYCQVVLSIILLSVLLHVEYYNLFDIGIFDWRYHLFILGNYCNPVTQGFVKNTFSKKSRWKVTEFVDFLLLLFSLPIAGQTLLLPWKFFFRIIFSISWNWKIDSHTFFSFCFYFFLFVGCLVYLFAYSSFAWKKYKGYFCIYQTKLLKFKFV